jgi:hypothetical protein
VPSGDYLRVTVEFDDPGDRLSGWLVGPDHERRRFSGWLELASGLTRLRASAPSEANEVLPPHDHKGLA